MKNQESSFFMRLLNYLIDYGLITVTVIFAILFSFQTSSPNYKGDAQQWILVILAFLATTQLVDKFRVMRGLENKISSIEQTLKSATSGNVDMFLELLPDLKERIRSAKTVSVCGLALLSTSLRYKDVYREKLKQGGQLRFVVMDFVDEKLLEVAAASIQKPVSKEILLTDSQRGYDILCQIFSQTKIKEGSGIRLLSARPVFGMFLFDGGTNQAEAWIWFYYYQEYTGPKIHLLQTLNKPLLDYYQSQFEKMWQNSRLAYPSDEQKGSNHAN